MKKISFFLIFTFFIFFLYGCASNKEPEVTCGACVAPKPLNLDTLSNDHITQVKKIIATLKPYIDSLDKSGKLPYLSLTDLQSRLESRDFTLLSSFRLIDPAELGTASKFQGFSYGDPALVKLENQTITLNGKKTKIPPQFLTAQVYAAYEAMSQAMEKDLGKRLYIESAYRSSAYQLYLFVFYLQNHDYSIRETAKWVALPGYSEHGNTTHLALDFINQNGISGETDPQAFENLIEYKWLEKNAHLFGFVLSYPKSSQDDVTFEPWHWRFDR